MSFISGIAAAAIIASTPASVKRTLSSFRLRELHEGVFIR